VSGFQHDAFQGDAFQQGAALGAEVEDEDELHGTPLRRGNWRRRASQPSPPPRIKRKKPLPKPEPEVVGAPPLVAPRQINGGFLSRLSRAPEYSQVSVLRDLTEDAISAHNRETVRRLNSTLEALELRLVEKAQGDKRRAELLALQEQLAVRQAAIDAEIEEEDEMILLWAA
jgi:hypothetical protein